MPFFAVTYTYSDDTALRDEHRPAHRAFLAELFDAQVLAASGPLAPTAEVPGGALIVLRAEDGAAALSALDADPFLAVGAVTRRSAQQWTPVTGPWSAEV